VFGEREKREEMCRRVSGKFFRWVYCGVEGLALLCKGRGREVVGIAAFLDDLTFGVCLLFRSK
jgi:hypothetical protein